MVVFFGKTCKVIGYTKNDEFILERQGSVGTFTTNVSTQRLSQENEYQILESIWDNLLFIGRI